MIVPRTVIRGSSQQQPRWPKLHARFVSFKYSLIRFRQKTGSYIRNFPDSYRKARNEIVREYDVPARTRELIGLTIDVAVTGAAVWFVVNWWGNPLSYGVAILLVMNAIKWLVQTVRAEKPKEA